MPAETPVSSLIELAFFGGLIVFAAYMVVWYFKECEQIDRDFEPLDRRLEELRIRNEALRIRSQEWLDNQKKEI